MKILYGDDVTALPAEDVNWSQVVGLLASEHKQSATEDADGNSLLSIHTCFSIDEHRLIKSNQANNSKFKVQNSLTAWGWDASLVRRLVKRGVPRELMPTDEQLATIRRLSHRRTALVAAEACGIKPMGEEAFRLSEVQALLDRHRRVVLKAPWSGSGRGLRWVDNALSAHDADWLEKLLATQGSVIVEPRCEVMQDFALEYNISSQQSAVSGQQSISPCAGTHFAGYSLFATQNGVYRENLLLSDDEILQRLSGFVPLETISSAKTSMESWLQAYVAPKYEGPLGVDMFIYRTADGYALNPMVEINFRHTMGHVAVALRGKTEEKTFRPEPRV